jgi:diadenosine tetraphosphate (Ap4A) HIT family hydrolase
MFMPKRHFREYSEMSVCEAGELVEMYRIAIDKYRTSGLKRCDGKDVRKYVFFWRLRDDLYDPVSGNTRPDHFHIHLAPDKDHLWDPVIEEKAYTWEVSKLIIKQGGAEC